MSDAPLFLTIKPAVTNGFISTATGIASNDQIALKTAEVTGIVTEVTFPKIRGEPTIFKIRCPNMKKTFQAVCEFYCPIRVNDTIYALCMIDANMVLHLSRPPFVQPAIDKDSIIQCLMRALKQAFKVVIKLYNTIVKIAG